MSEREAGEGVIRLEFTSDKTGDKLANVSQRSEEAGSKIFK